MDGLNLGTGGLAGLAQTGGVSGNLGGLYINGPDNYSTGTAGVVSRWTQPQDQGQPTGLQRLDNNITPLPRFNDGYNNIFNTQAEATASATKHQNIDYVNRAFDAKRAGLQGQYDTLEPQRQAAEFRVANQYQNQRNGLETGLAQGTRNLNIAKNQVEDSSARGLKSLADQVRQQGMSYANQLGTFGAGDSSAAGMINIALGNQASRGRGDVMRGASSQLQDISNQDADLHTSYDQNIKALDDWKQGTLADLATQFAQQKNAILSEMANADVSRQQQLAQYDAALTQSALDRLSQIEGMYKQQSADLINKFQNIGAPQDINLPANLQQYAVKPLDPGTLNGLSMPAAVNPEAEQLAVLRKRFDEQNNPLN